MITFLMLLIVVLSMYLLDQVVDPFFNPRATLCDRLGLIFCVAVLVFLASTAINTLLKVNS